MNKKVILMILDGWGKSPDPKVSAIDNAKIPFINSLYKNYPNAQLRTDGLNVGLPEGQMGNSEVGHMNLGAGRIIYQDLVKINLAIQTDTLKNEPILVDALDYALKQNVNVHLLGLLSDGGVHSHTSHLRALIDCTQDIGLKKVFVHAFTDGRDVDPKSGINYIQNLENYLALSPVKIASVIGRYYAMDRDSRWERIKLAYDLLVKGIGKHTRNIQESIAESYSNAITDEFIQPLIIVNDDNIPLALIQENDVVIFFNFRTDRGRELTEALSQKDFPEQNMHKLNLYYVTMTNYDENFKNINVIYKKDNLMETLGEVLEKNYKKQIRIAETEKYPHVTYFFSGGREQPFIKETRILRNSPKVPTYDLQPEMSAYELTEALLPELEKGEVDFVCLNFANGDMVGHTGSMTAAIKACEAVDQCVEKVITTALANDYTTLVIADHGNCETMINSDGSPNTAHTTNPVPIILVDKKLKYIKDGVLSDVAPTILELIGIEKPEIMDRHSLLHPFDLSQIHQSSKKVNSGADFPKYMAELKQMGVLSYDYYLSNSKTIYYGENNFFIEDQLMDEAIEVAPITSVEKLVLALKEHQQGLIDFPAFCIQVAKAGVDKWECNCETMICTYLNKNNKIILEEKIPIFNGLIL